MERQPCRVLTPCHYTFKNELLNVHYSMGLTILIIDATDLVLSKFYIPAIGFNQCLHSTQHTVNQTIKHFLPNVPLYLHQSLPEFLPNCMRRSTKGCSVRISLVKFHFEQCPQVLDRIHIEGIWRLFHHHKSMFNCRCIKKGLGFFEHMRPSIVLLECNTIYAIAGQCIEVWEEVITEDRDS